MPQQRVRDCGHTPIYNTFNKIKYLWINLTKEVKGIYNGNLKPPKKEIETLENWKTSQAHGLIELILWKLFSDLM